jgi:hypothetical protein
MNKPFGTQKFAKVKTEGSETGGDATATEAAAKPEKVKKEPAAPKKFTFVKEPTEGQKFAPQAKLILKHIQAVGADGITRKDLVTSLAGDAEFKTKQPIERIIGYYQPDLLNAGVVTLA